MTSGDLTFDLTLKMTEVLSIVILDELSNAVRRMSLRSSGAELDGGRKNAPPPPKHSMENPDHQHGAG